MNTREVESKLRCSGGKRVSKIKNCFTSGCHNKKGTTVSTGYRWAPFLIFQLFIALLVVQPNAWAGLLPLSVYANGDNVFNGNEEKLIISFTTSGFGDDNQQYKYEIKLDDARKITEGPDEPAGQKLSKNQTVQFIWDGTVNKGEKLPDGDYTITVKLKNSDGTELPPEQTDELTAQVTLDTKAPEISISIDNTEFSRILENRFRVHYSGLDEDVDEAWLELQKNSGGDPIKKAIDPSELSKGSSIYYWDGTDNNNKSVFDGQYTLQLKVKDKGGNVGESNKTDAVTIDSTELRIGSISLNDSTLIDGMFVNTAIRTISFTVQTDDGTPDITDRNTKIQIRPIDSINIIKGTLTNKTTFTLSDPIDELNENGKYEVTVSVDNLTSSRVFTFDNAAPILKSVATHSGEFAAGSGISGLTNYVEATLEDNIELNLADSTIRLKGPSGSAVLGQQTRPADDKIRWQLLSPLLAKDGVHDGQYTVEVIAADKAGNRTSPIQITFLFDNLAPELVSVKPARDGEPFNILGDTVFYNLPLNQFVATFDDGEFGTGVIFSGADDISRIIFGTPKTDGGVDAISGRAFPDLNNNVLTYILDDPLLNSDGSQDGSYRLNVKAADSLGNSKIYSFHLIYDTQVPTLASTVPAANQSVQDLSQVVVKLNETTSGIDFVQSVFALKRNMGENQVEVPVNISSNGTDTATLTLLQPIALDGSDDGTYVIEVTPTDRAGNLGAVIRREFYLVSQARPQVKLVTPETGTVNSLGDITVELVDYIGSGINFDASTITVRNAQGQIVPQAEVVAEAATNQLTWSTEATIPKGAADGRYTISASFRDYSGVVITQTFNLNLDTISPSITSVQVGTDALNQLSLDSTIDVTESFSHINIEFDATDVDFENTVVTVADPDGNEIAGRKNIDGEALLTLNFQSIAKLGTYTLTVTPIDNIGNVSQTPFIYKFNIDIAVPVVTSVLIDGQSGAIVYVKGTAGEIVATIVDTTGIGIAVGQGGSNIAVTTDSGLPAPGRTTLNDENQLIWRPSVLPSDGSADGRYTVSVTPVDKAGRTGDVAYRAFIYDTQSPQITAATPISLHQPISYVGDSLEQFQFSVEDVGPALLDLDDQTISLTKKSGEAVAGHITHDNNNQLFFTLPAPLPTDGSADGEYTLTVNLVDKAGNPSQVQHTIIYDSQAPQIVSVSLNTETPLNLTPYQVTDLPGSISKITLNFIEMTRIDFDNTIITLMGPDGSTIPLTLENNGTDEITASFVSLIQGGLYTLSVTPQDMTGNTPQGEVPYPFKLKFEVPGITSVHANSVDASYELAAYKILDITDTISNFTVTFTDASRVDFERTTVTLTGPNGQVNTVTKEHGDGSQFVARFVTLGQNGLYTLSITPQDIGGNVAQSPMQYQFKLDITLPTVSSVLIDSKPGTNILINDPDTEIVATFADASGVGLAFGNSGSTITVNNDQGIVVTGIISSNGTNQLTWTPAALPTDGSADGRYTVTITPLDKSGRTGTVVTRHFIYDTQAPRITNATSIILHQPMSYIGGNMPPFEFTVEDVGPSLLDLADQTIGLRNEDGEIVAGHVTNDGVNRLFFTPTTPLSTDGSEDGEYTLTINLVDKAGNTHQTTHKIYYDSQVPRISAVSLNTEIPIVLTPYQITDLSESVNQLTLNFIETTQVNFAATTVTLTGTNNTAIPLTLENNGLDQLTVSFVSLTQEGLYTLTVTPQDIAGNTAQGVVSYPFRLEFDMPEIASVKVNTADTSLDLTPYEIIELSEPVQGFTLEFTNESRVDFERTSVVLTGPNGQQIPVILEDDDDATLSVRFVALDQSGLYTLSITPQDIDGTVAQNAVSYQFRLKFEVPGLESVTAHADDTSVALIQHDIVEISESIGSLTLKFTDAQRVDFVNTTVTLSDPNGQEIPVTLEGNENSQLTVRFVPLTQSGIYTISVTPQDIAGNVAQTAIRYQFRLDTTLPTVDSVLIDGKVGSTVYVKTAVPRIIAAITDSLGVGLSVGDTGSTIVVTNSQGIQVSATTTLNAANQLTWIPIPLPVDGSADGEYTVVITPVDKVGRTGTVVRRQFIYDTQAPRLTSATPITLHAPISYLGSGLNQFVLTVEDVGPSDIVYASQVVALMDATGKPVPAKLTYDELTNQLYLTLDTPFASDGTADGPYTLNVLLIDKAGNRLTTRFNLVYDSIIPQVSSVQVNTAGTPIELSPSQVAELSESVDTITIKFNEATRVDFENTSILLLDPNSQTIPLTVGDDGVSQMTLSFVALTQIGQYTLSVTPQDIAGNVAQSPIQYAFNLEFILPDVESIIIGDTITLGSADTAYVNADNLVIAANLLDPAGTGLSFDTTGGSNIIVATLDGTIVRGSVATNGTDLLVWRPITLSNDGSSDGRYAVYVYAVDKKGREANVVYREFVYDTQEPEITNASPMDLSQPVSYISESLTQFQWTIQDVGPADLMLEDQVVTLRNQSGVLVPTKLTNDTNNQLFLTLDEPLPLDGSRDGQYTLEIAFSDRSENVLSINHPIVYDTQAPTLVSTVPADNEQLTEDITQIQVSLDDKGESGIDWSRTTVTLIDPNGITISGDLSSDGKSQLTLKTNQLVADGRYVIQVQAIDRAGNGGRTVHESDFLLSRRLPAIVSTVPITAPRDEAYTNQEVDEIEVLLETVDTRHLSTVRLLNAEGQEIAGQQHRATGKLIYRLVRPLTTDGSEDGDYTIEFTPISSSGRSGTAQSLVFTYDTQSPELDPKDVHLIVAEQEVDNSLVRIRLDITDNQAGVDWENLDTDWVTFERISPDSDDIDGSVQYVSDEPEHLIFTLNVPLADDGSADGKYRITVTPIDKAGNGDETYEKEFTYDTSPPVIDPNSLLLNDAPLLTDIDADDYPSAVSTPGGVVIQAVVSDTGLGVNLSQSRISVRNPNSQELSGTTRQNGVDTLVFKSDGLNIEGIYQVTVTATGNDTELLGITPQGSITTAFLYETTEPTAVVTDDGGKTELTDEALPLIGTATDPEGVRRAGQQGENEVPVPASGVWLVEIVGTGPDGQPIEPVPAEDDSDAQQEPWSRWTADFLPTRSGDYDLDIRVTDRAGNYAVYDYGEVTMSVSFTFSGNTFVWPNPLRQSNDDVGFFSYELNTSDDTVKLGLYIYDWSGDMVYSKTYDRIEPGHRNGNEVSWQLKNSAGNRVARGIYVFRLEAVDGAGNRANAVGKILVVD